MKHLAVAPPSRAGRAVTIDSTPQHGYYLGKTMYYWRPIEGRVERQNRQCVLVLSALLTCAPTLIVPIPHWHHHHAYSTTGRAAAVVADAQSTCRIPKLAHDGPADCAACITAQVVIAFDPQVPPCAEPQPVALAKQEPRSARASAELPTPRARGPPLAPTS